MNLIFIFVSFCLLYATCDDRMISKTFQTSLTNRLPLFPDQNSSGIPIKLEMIQIQYRPGCTKDGKNFKEGEVYRVEHLIYRCENDFMLPQGCYTTDGNDIKIGQKIMDYDKNSIYECFGANLKIGYNEKYCGRFHPCEDFPEEEKKKFKPQHHYRIYSEAIINP